MKRILLPLLAVAALLVGAAQASENTTPSVKLGIAAGLTGLIGGSLITKAIQEAIEPNIYNYKKADGSLDLEKWRKAGTKRRKYASQIELGLLATSSAAINLALFTLAKNNNNSLDGFDFAAASTATQLATPGLLIAAGTVAGALLWEAYLWAHRKGNVYWF